MDKVKAAAEDVLKKHIEHLRIFRSNVTPAEAKALLDGIYAAMEEYAANWQSSNQDGAQGLRWVKASERVPNHTKHVFAKNEKGTRFTAFYTKGGYPIEMEWEDEDDLPDYVHNDREVGQLYLKEGWYEERENTGTDYEYIFCERNIVEWLDESTPSPNQSGDLYKEPNGSEGRG